MKNVKHFVDRYTIYYLFNICCAIRLLRASRHRESVIPSENRMFYSEYIIGWNVSLDVMYCITFLLKS